MKEKDTLTKGVLTLLKAGLDRAEKEKGSELSQLESIEIVQREIKQTKQSLEWAVKTGEADRIENENKKIDILSSYLPKQLSEDEVANELKNEGVTSGMNMGDAMKIAKPLLTGRVDNSIIAKVVKELIK